MSWTIQYEYFLWFKNHSWNIYIFFRRHSSIEEGFHCVLTIGLWQSHFVISTQIASRKRKTVTLRNGVQIKRRRTWRQFQGMELARKLKKLKSIVYSKNDNNLKKCVYLYPWLYFLKIKYVWKTDLFRTVFLNGSNKIVPFPMHDELTVEWYGMFYVS